MPRTSSLTDWLASTTGGAKHRVARVDDGVVVVSRFPPHFIETTGSTIERLGLLENPDPLVAAATRRGRTHPLDSRVENWRIAAEELVRERVVGAGMSEAHIELVTAGLDSVAALMGAVLWSNPLVGDAWEAGAAERAAWRDALARTEGSRDIFTRHYGVFEGKSVVSHCPGSGFARAFLDSAWRACTGTPPPAVEDVADKG